MSIKLDNLSVSELQALIKKANDMIQRKQAQEAKLADARAEIERIVRESGVSVDVLMQQPSKPARKTSAVRKPVAAKYRNAAGETWSGRGKRPRWLADAIAKGASLESFEIR